MRRNHGSEGGSPCHLPPITPSQNSPISIHYNNVCNVPATAIIINYFDTYYIYQTRMEKYDLKIYLKCYCNTTTSYKTFGIASDAFHATPHYLTSWRVEN